MLTGGSENSLAAEAAITIASAKPAQIVIAARTKAKVDPVIEAIRAVDASIQVDFLPVDLADNASVRKAAAELNALVFHIDVLINSAGVMAKKNYETSKDGVELHFAANHLGHFLLTKLVLEKIVKAKGRVVNVSSMAYFIAEADTEDPNFEVGTALTSRRA